MTNRLKNGIMTPTNILSFECSLLLHVLQALASYRNGYETVVLAVSLTMSLLCD